MKKIMLIGIGIMASLAVPAQVNKKDTMRVDTAHIEKIKKMPMDSIPGNMPIKKTPEDVPQKGKKEQPIGIMNYGRNPAFVAEPRKVLAVF